MSQKYDLFFQPRIEGKDPRADLASASDLVHIPQVHDIPEPYIDKHALVGGCVRLPQQIDAERLATEVSALPSSVWDVRGGKHRYPQQGVHAAADTVFLRGHTPAEGDKPIEDRPLLKELGYIRQLIEREIGTRPQRCMLARLPAGASVLPHVDRAPYFSKTLRVHVPIESNDRVWMFCAGLAYQMKPGQAWALNNVAVHAVWNAHPSLARTHLICDFLPEPALLALLARGERGLGRPMPDADAHFASLLPGPAIEGG